MTNREKFKEVFGHDLSFNGDIIRCEKTADDCKTCKYGSYYTWQCNRGIKWANEEYKEPTKKDEVRI